MLLYFCRNELWRTVWFSAASWWFQWVCLHYRGWSRITVCVPAFIFHTWIIFLIEARAYRAMWDYFYVQIRRAAASEIIFQDSYYRCRRCSSGVFDIQLSENTQWNISFVVVVLSFSRPWLYFHYSWCLISKICLQPVYINVKIIFFWGKKKKRISFPPPSCDKCRICVEVYRSE